MDYFVQLSKNPTAKSVVKGLGLPVPMPPVLRRAQKPWAERLLNDATVVAAGLDPAPLLDVLGVHLAPAGARVQWASKAPVPEPVVAAGQAWAHPVQTVPEPAEGTRARALVFDASGVAGVGQLAELYEFFHTWLGALDKGGRVLVLGRPVAGEPNLSAARAALEGFTRSLSKELGRKGATANLLLVQPGAETRAVAPVRFFLSDYSSFITGQPLWVSGDAKEAVAVPAQQALQGRVALVTGSSRGIGAETARILAREGAHVVILDRPGTETEASQLARSLGGSMFLADITEAGAGQRICDHLRSEHGGVDIVVHNAGVTRDKTLRRMKRDAWDMVLGVNLQAAMTLTTELLNSGTLRDGGRIINLSSVGGIAGNPGQTNYGASKAGLIGYTRSLARELAGRGITVNAIAPGLIETKMTAKMPAFVREAGRRLSSLNQGGVPKDVAEAITFFAMPWAHGCTGQVLRVCGGALIGA